MGGRAVACPFVAHHQADGGRAGAGVLSPRGSSLSLVRFCLRWHVLSSQGTGGADATGLPAGEFVGWCVVVHRRTAATNRHQLARLDITNVLDATPRHVLRHAQVQTPPSLPSAWPDCTQSTGRTLQNWHTNLSMPAPPEQPLLSPSQTPKMMPAWPEITRTGKKVCVSLGEGVWRTCVLQPC